MTAFLIFIGAIIALAMFAIAIYNGLVKLRTTAESSWSDIDVQLKKRYNLVPALVETVKGYAKHESGLFEKVTKARSQAMQGGSPEEIAAGHNMLTGTLKSLFAVSEAYPDLKANSNFLELQKQFEEIESDIESARRYYNAVVRDYNIKTETFPSAMVASMFNFTKKEFFEIETPEERNAIKPDFS
ncbi:MAG: LemA family protein [bacterium]|nr:LemA family protein [bacterium]